MLKWTTLIALIALLFLTACPSKPVKEGMSDPSDARSRGDKAMQELDRETR